MVCLVPEIPQHPKLSALCSLTPWLEDVANVDSKICAVNLTPYDGAFEKACIQSQQQNGPRRHTVLVGRVNNY